MPPKQHDHWLIFALALVVRLLAAFPQTQPNYMDAAYYLVGGQRLAQGYGFNDPYVWNYLDQPIGLPNPSHLYWMPLPSMMVAISQSLFGMNYRAAQIPFVLLSSVLPVIAYSIAWRMSDSRRNAWIAALLTIFSAYYLPYWGVPESFAPFAVFGALALYWGSPQGDKETRHKGRLLLAGACAGLAHLSRADGMVLVVALLLAQVYLKVEAGRRRLFIPHPSSVILLFAGYLVVMLPWFLRNLGVIGSPLSSAGAQTLWLCNYDELFAYGVRFDLNHLLGCGLDRVLLAKINGVAVGGLHWLAEMGMIFLAPLIVVGARKERRAPLFRAAIRYAALLFVVMTLAFPFAGDRGGLFHSSGALLPFAYATVPIGLEAIIGWIAIRRRTWTASTAQLVFSAALIVLAIGLSFAIYRGRVIGADWQNPIWNQAGAVDTTIGHWLTDRDGADPVVMVNNPPAFTYYTGLRSIVIPYGTVDDLLRAARQFGARWLVLDVNRPEPLAGLYADPVSDPRLSLRATFDGIYVLEAQPDG